MLGLRFCARASPSCSKRGPLFIAVRGPLTIVASLVVEHRLQMHRLSSCGSRAQSLRGMWDPHRPGLEPVSPVLAGRFSITAPPRKPQYLSFSTSWLSMNLFGLFVWRIYCCKERLVKQHSQIWLNYRTLRNITFLIDWFLDVSPAF